MRVCSVVSNSSRPHGPCQAPLSMEFSRQKYWSRLPFPTLGDLPNPRIEPESLVFPAWAGGFFFFTTVPPGKPYKCFSSVQSLSRVQLFAAPWIAASLSITNSRVHPDSNPSSQWCHPAISSSVIPFASCPQSLPASESFPMSQFFRWGGQSTSVSALASFLPKKSQGWSPSVWTGWISLQYKGLSRSSPTLQFKSINSLALSFLHSPTLTSIHDHRKNYSLD